MDSSVDMKTRSLSVGTTAMTQADNVLENIEDNKMFSRCQSESGTNNTPVGFEANGQVKLPEALSGFLNEMNSFKPRSSDEDVYFKRNHILPTIPSESNLEASLAQARKMASSTTQMASLTDVSLLEPRKPGISFKDSDDLIKLKERVMSMKATMRG